jgi:hypothetical protein
MPPSTAHVAASVMSHELFGTVILATAINLVAGMVTG